MLVIFFSILNYIGDQYGFAKDINCNFNLIKNKQFETYRNGFGKVRLQQIKYKYFSDKALELWELCYAFFDNANKIFTNKDQKEYLLVKNFNIVFEAIIDELIGDRDIPKGLKEQEDGKRVDHMYTYKGLTSHEENKPIYYIGDSKYYKIGNKVGKESVYKQFTYARNVIQWNLNLFMNGDKGDKEWIGRVPMLRDERTEGYNIIPNFFISARLNRELNYKEEIEQTCKKHTHFSNKHFENRLFDRDTLLISHYDVNFLYVVSLYARNNTLQKDAWKEKVRAMFREEIQRILAEKYDFYAMTAHPDVDADAYIKEHFQDILGKIYSPYTDKGVFSLALDNDKSFKESNDKLLYELQKYFYIKEISIGENPTEALEEARVQSIPISGVQKNGVLMIMMENYADKCNKFLTDGKLAVGIKYTKDSMEIVEHLSNIGYVLFHTRKDEGQHLFAIEGNPEVKSTTELDASVYKNVKTTSMYVLLNLNTQELDSSLLHSSKKNYTSSEFRYDAQYATLEELK